MQYTKVLLKVAPACFLLTFCHFAPDVTSGEKSSEATLEVAKRNITSR